MATRGPCWGREPGPAGLKATETDSNLAPLPQAELLSRSQRRQICSLVGGRRMWAVGGAGSCGTQAGRPDPTLRPIQHLGPRESWSVCMSPGTSPGHAGTLDPPPQGAVWRNFETLGIGPCWAVFSKDRVSHLRPNPHEMGKLEGTVRAAWGPGVSPCQVAPRARSGGGTGQQLGRSSCVCPGMSPGLLSRPVQGTETPAQLVHIKPISSGPGHTAPVLRQICYPGVRGEDARCRGDPPRRCLRPPGLCW